MTAVEEQEQTLLDKLRTRLPEIRLDVEVEPESMRFVLTVNGERAKIPWFVEDWADDLAKAPPEQADTAEEMLLNHLEHVIRLEVLDA